MKKHRLFALLMIILLSCQGNKEQQTKVAARGAPAAAIPVQTISLRGENFTEYGEFIGKVTGREQASLISYTGGKVKSVRAEEGAKVRAGERLCDIDGDSFGVALKSAQLQQKVAEETYERNKLHLKKGLISELQLDQAQAKFLQAKAAVIEANKNYEAAFCISPINGMVVERQIQAHQDLTPGSPTITIADVSKVKLTFGVPENEISGYKVGSEALISLTATPGSWKGKITSVAQSVNDQSRTFKAEVIVENPEGALKPGLTARVRIERFKLKEQIVVPTDAIITSGAEQYIYVVKDNVAKKRLVKVWFGNEERSVINEGLQLGEDIIIKGQLLAGDGAPVRVISKE